MSSRGLVLLGAIFAMLSAPAPAHAFSCSPPREPMLERCRNAALAYAGVVEAVEHPFMFEPASGAVVQLRVDTVWRGAPPQIVLAYEGMAAGLPYPGLPFMFCQEEAIDDTSWTVVGTCSRVSFGEFPEVHAMLGPGRAPSLPPALAWQWFRTEELLGSLALVLALPLLGVALGASIGRGVRRRVRAVAAAGSPFRVLLLFAIAMLVARLCLRAALADDGWPAYDGELRRQIVTGSTIVIATIVGLWLGYRGQRRSSGPLRGLAVALLGSGSMLFTGFVRLHVPIQPADTLACSQARAREFLSSVPIDAPFRIDEDGEWDPSPATVAVHEEAIRVAQAAVPYGCADWGVRRMRYDPGRACVEFEDGVGGTYRQCVDTSFYGFDEEPPG